MHTVVETPTFVHDTDAAQMSEDERMEIVIAIAANPTVGDVMSGTGGARKVRFAGRGKGKSGGYRVVTFYTGRELPVFLLALIDKGRRANLSKAERNELRKELTGLVDDYRAAVKAKATEIKKEHLK
jgi:hypothetical protein